MSAPLGKLLLSEVQPVTLAGLLYLGSSAGITLLILVGGKGRNNGGEAPIRLGDLPVLGVAILSGGIIAPILLFYGLSRTPASTASLLLNTEAVLTTLLAALLFREWIGRRVWLSAGLMLLASFALAYSGSITQTSSARPS